MPNLPNISPELLKAYQEEIERRTSGATVKRKMSALRRFFSWAEQKGHIEESPIPTTSQATFQPVQLQTTPKEKEETKQPTPSKDIKQAQRWLTPANAVRGGILVALVVLVLLLVGRVELPIPFRKTPATDQGPTATPTDTPAQQPAILSPWTLYARLTLTRQDGSPVIGSQSVTFKLYQNEEDTSPLHTFSPKEVTTDQEGSTLVALDEVPTELFFENEKLFLGGEIDGSELSTRLPVSTANQSANLQGFYPAQEAGANTIPVLSSDGSLLLAAEAPSIRATSGNLLVEGNTLTLSTPDVSDGDITINPDGSGTANFIFEGTGGNLINAQASNIISGSLYSGTVANDATGYNLITLQSGSETTTKFSVDALGNTYVGANLDIEHDLSTGGEKRLTSEGKLENITGYEQESGNFSITQDGGDTASISKKNVTALSDLLTLTLDERGKPETSNSIYSTLVLRRYDGATEAMALHVDEGNATFDGQLRLGRFDTNPSTIGTGTLIFNSTDGNVYVWTGTSWVSLGGLTGSSIWSRSSGVIFPTTSTDDLAVGGTDSTSAFFVNDSGTITFSTDTNLYRSAANTLRTDDNLSVGGTISGDGSGLTNVNADTLDSLDSTQFLRSDTSDNYTSGTLTFDSGTTLDVNGDFSVADTNISFDGASTTFTFTGAATLSSSSVTASDAFSVNGNATLGDANTDTVTYNARISSDIVPSADSTYDLGSNTLRWANVYADNLVGTISPGFTEGSIVFADASGDLAQDNANLFFDDTNDLVGIGTNSPIAKLQVEGAVTGKALSIFNETGDQDIFTASASGTTRVRVTNAGNLYITGTLNTVSGNLTIDSAGGQTTVNDNLVVTGTSDLQGNVSNSTGDLTISDNLVVTGTSDLQGAVSNSTGNLNLNDSVDVSGDLAVNGGDITSTQTTFNLLNSTPTTINFGGAATTLSIGAGTGTTTVNNNVSVIGNTTLGDTTADTVTYNARVSSDIVPSVDSTYDLGTNTLRWANVYADNLVGTISPGFSEGSIVFTNASGDLAEDNANLFFDDTNDLVGIGTNNPTSKLHVSGAVTGKALVIFDETGDQDILTASASGTTRVRITNGGNLYITGTLNTVSGNLTLDSAGGQTSVSDNFVVTGTSDLQGNVSNSTGNLTLDDTVDVTGNLDTAGTLAVGTSDALTVDTSGNLTTAGDIAVNGGDITTTQSTFNLLNATPTTINFGGAATTLSIGASSGTTTVNNALTVTGTLTANGDIDLGDANTDTVTFTARVDSNIVPSADSTYDLGTNTLRWANVYADNLVGTISPGFTEGSIVFADSNGDLAQDNANLFFDDTNDLVGIGTNSPTSRLHVTGAVTGKALATFDETGDQNILTASASGTTVANLDRSGNLAIDGTISDLNGTKLIVDDDLQVNGDTIFDSGGANRIQLGSTIALTGNASVSQALSVDGNTTLGDSDTDSVTFNADVASNIIPATDSTYDLGSNTVRWANVYADNLVGTVSPGFTQGSIVFADANGDLAEDNASLFFDDTNNLVGVGTNSPTSKLHVTGAVTGKALSIFDETGDQNILTASASGTTRFVIENDGDVGINTSSPGETLDVSGTGRFYDQTPSTGVTTLTLRAGQGQVSNALLRWQNDSGGSLGSINTTGVGIGQDVSDERLRVWQNGSGESALFEKASGASGETVVITNDGSGNSFLVNDESSDTSPFVIDTSGKVGVGLSSPVGKLDVTGAVTGKALAIFDETGDQNILTASASGTTVANLDGSGNLQIEGTISDLTDATLTVDDGLQVNGNTTLGDTTGDTITFTARAASDLLPSTDNTYDLGSASLQWAEIRGVAIYQNGNQVCDSTGANCPSGGDAGPWNETTGIVHLDTTSWQVSIGDTTTEHKLEVEGAVTGKALVSLWEKGDQDILVASNSATPTNVFRLANDGSIVSAGDAAINGGDLTSSQTTFNLLNTTVTTLNLGGAATALEVGAASGTTSINNSLTIDGNTTIGDASGDSVTANASTWTFANDTNFALSGGINGLSFDTDTFSVDATNNLIGIGTTSPVGKLHLTGAVTGKALSIFNETGDQDIFTASASGTTRMTLDNSGNLGIGADPTARLHLAKDDASTNTQIELARLDRSTSGTAAANIGQYISFYNETDNGTLMQAGRLQFDSHIVSNVAEPDAGGNNASRFRLFVERETWDDFTPAFGAYVTGGARYLCMNGTDSDNLSTWDCFGMTIGSANSVNLVFDGTNRYTMNYDSGSSQVELYATNIADDLELKTLGSQPISFDTSDDGTDVYIQSDGNVGIGTVSPTSKLHLDGAITGKALAIFNETGDQDILTASASGTTRFRLTNAGNIDTSNQTVDWTLNNAVDALNFDSDTLSIDASANEVGIGTAAPGAKLHVNSASGLSAIFGDTGLEDHYIQIRDGGSGSIYFGLDSSLGGNGAGLIQGGANKGVGLSVNSDTFGATPSLYIDTSGQVGIGTSTPGNTLDVQGEIEALNGIGIGINPGTYGQLEVAKASTDNTVAIFSSTGRRLTLTASNNGTIGMTSGDIILDAAGGDITTDERFTVGTETPGVGQLNVTGAETGKALSIFDETGDQAIFTASQSGTPRFTIENSGDITWAAATPSLTFNNGETLSFSDGTNDLVAIKDQDAYAFFNLKGKGTTGDPASCAEGDIYYNAADDTVSVCHSGNTWEQLDGGGGGGGGSSVWTHIAHAVYPNDYWADDVLVGGNSTASATFRIAANGNLDSSNNTIDWSLNNAADALNIDSNTLSIDASNDRIGVGTTGPDAKIDSLSTTGEQLRLTYTDGSVYTGFTTDSAGDLTIDATGGDIIFSDTDTLNIGGSGSQVAYNAIADTVAGASGNVDSDDDLYIEGNLEVDGDIYDASGNVVAGYWTLSGSNLYATSTDYLVGVGTNSPISRLHVATNTTTLTGKSAFIVDQLESEDILSASASGTTKMTLTNDGTLKLFNASSTISNTSGDITIDAASNLISFAGDDLSNIGTVTAGTGIFTSALQVADSTAQAYSRLGTATTGHSGNLTAGDDLLISGDLELDSNFYLDGGNISNSSGTATITFTGSPTTAENTLSASSWLIENTANVGKAALMVNQTKAGDILTASASGTTRMTLDNSGNLGLGVDPTAQFHLRKDDASTNTQIELARLDRTTSGTAAANIGQYMSFYNETDNGSLMEAGRFQFDSHIVSNVAEPDAGGNNASRFRLFVERETWDDFTPAFGAYVTGGARYLCMNGTDSDNLSTWDCFGMTIGSANSVNLVFDGTNRYTMNYDSGSSQVELYATNIADDLELKTLGSQPISFDTSDDGTDVYIQSDGNVGIGDTSPSVQLNVGSANTTHGLGASDALISDALEVDGVLYLDGGNISNSAGTASMLLTATPTTATNTLSASSWLVENTANLGQAALIVNNTKGTDGTTDIFTASASGTTRFRVNRDGGTYITGSADTLFTVGGGSGKIDVGTVDPVYSIGNKKYATYMAGMIGVKEETTGSVKTTEYVPGYGYRQTIDFTKQEKGSDLWLFSKATDLEKHINDMVVLLSPSDNTRAWYTVDPNNYTLSIYTSRPTSVSYRLTAPRFDADLWTNYNTNPESVGFMLEDNPLTVKEDGEIKEAEDNYIANLEIEDTGQSDGFFETDPLTVFNLKDEAGNVIHEIGQASKFVAANIKAGAIETGKLSTKSFIAFQGQIDSLLVRNGLVSPYIETQTISPIADSDVTVSLDNSEEKDGSSYGRFVVEGEDEKEVATIDSQGNATFSGTVESEDVKTNEITASKIYADEIISRSGKFGEISSATSSAVTLEDIEKLLKEAETDQKTLASATDSNIYTATNSATLDEIAATDLYVTNQAAINALSVSETVVVGNDFSIQVTKDELGLAKATSINTLSSPLQIQSLALAPVEIMSGLVSIDTNGDVSIEGNLYVAGNINSQGLTIRHDDSGPESATNSGFFRLLDSQGQEIAGINASGSANFSQVATDKLVIAGSEATTSASLLDGLVTETSATAGTARITSGVRDITIRSPQITDNTLVYVTPTSTTLNNVLYVKKKGEGFFTAGFNSALDIDVEFNWWVIDVTNPISSTKISN